MQKLRKLSLRNISGMTEQEMKLVVGGSASGNCSMHCYDGTVIDVSSCSDTSKCSNHGGAQNCNGTSGSSCLNN